MKYIVLSTRALEIEGVTDSVPQDAPAIPVVEGRYELAPLIFKGKETTDFPNLITSWASVIADEEASAKAGTPVSSMIAPPDPWVLALASLMWQAVVQGMTWDVTKAALERGLAVLRREGVAPAEGETRTASRTRFSYSVDWDWFKKLHVKLEFNYEKMKEQRQTPKE